MANIKHTILECKKKKILQEKAKIGMADPKKEEVWERPIHMPYILTPESEKFYSPVMQKLTNN